MPVVTVQGAAHSTISLLYDENSTAILARQVASEIKAGLDGGSIVAADNKSGPPPDLPPGKTGELVLSKDATTLLPAGYDYVVDAAKTSKVFGNGDPNELVLAGKGNLTFFATGGSGAVLTGGGDNMVSIPATDPGGWLISMGDGNDTVRALGGGNDAILLGSGRDYVQLGSGSTYITTEGSDTFLGGSGSETISASGDCSKELIYGNNSRLFFVAGGSATVFGGKGSDTVYGGSGKDLLEGGTAGGNFLQAGSGQATLFGGGDGDQLYAGGDQAQALHAASGNETLSGVGASGRDTFYGGSGSDQIFGGEGKNTFVAGTGAASITAGPGAKDVFEFMKSAGGGKELVSGLTDISQVHIDLVGYGSNEVAYALAHQSVTNGSVTVTLSDNTQVTFQDLGSLSKSNFVGFSSGDDRGREGDMKMSRDHGNSGDHGHWG